MRNGFKTIKIIFKWFKIIFSKIFLSAEIITMEELYNQKAQSGKLKTMSNNFCDKS